MKKCFTCQEHKPLTDFYKNAKSLDGLGSYCKSCMNIKYVEARKAKLEHYKLVQKTRVQQNVQKVREWKKERGCLLCSEAEPVCLDLHHLDPSVKEGHPADMVKISFTKFLTEAEKCVVLCKNCHAKIHAGIISL